MTRYYERSGVHSEKWNNAIMIEMAEYQTKYETIPPNAACT